MENVLPFSTLYSRPDAFRHLPSSGALTYKEYIVYTRSLRCLGQRRLKKKKIGRRSCLLTFIVISVRDISTNFFNSQLFT